MYEDELEALEAIFMEELTVSDDKKKIFLRILPFDDDSMNNVGIKMELAIPEEYPEVIPGITLHSIKGVTGRALNDLEATLKQEGTSHLGEPMIFIFAEIIKNWLGDNNNEEEQLSLLSLKSKKIEEKANYKEGTPVTVDTYEAWWSSFKAETALDDSLNNNNKLNGKLFFASLGDNATGDEELTDSEDGEEVIDGEKEVATVEVNWEVFAEEDLGEFDELSSDDFEEDEKVDEEKK
jgi:hypothetical protein